MKVFNHRWLLGLILLAIGGWPVSAQSTASITSFTTSFTEVGRSALTARTARIPVSWTTQNRPVTANLVFEQILPDGTRINVELPRLIPFVASNGDGIAAPILPDGEVSSITLRVSLISLFSDTVFDSREIVLPIVRGDNGGNGDGSVPAIIGFDPQYTTPISRAQLDAGTLRIPVTWQAINRPTWMNLIFEQVLPDGTVHNVELPRTNPWVNSADRGLVAPVSVGDSANQIVLRVRLADFFRDRTYDQIYAYIPIQSPQAAPEITSFSTRTVTIASDAVADGNLLIDVAWAVSNRPQNTNLVFEQVLPDGSTRNAELPRSILIVPSVGEGAVLPILPESEPDELTFQVRLVDLSNNQTLDSARISVALAYSPQEPEDNLTINSFTVDIDTAKPNTEVTFSWDIEGDFTSAQIEYPVRTGTAYVITIGEASGTVAHTIPDEASATAKTVTLTAEDSVGVSITDTLTLTVTCLHDWQLTITLDEDTCPATGQTVAGVYQSYERGFMLWMPDATGANSIYTFFNDGTADLNDDLWNEQDYTLDGTPPEGLLAPERGFGYLWHTMPAIRSGLGWAIAAEQNGNIISQALISTEEQPASIVYFELPDGRVVRFDYSNAPSYTWTDQ